MYMGNSPKHASTIPLILNPESGAITAQFHIVFDDWFATVAASENELPDLQADEWTRMFGDSIYQYPFDDVNRDEPDATEKDLRMRFECRRDDVAHAIEAFNPPTPLQAVPPPEVVPSDKSPFAASTPASSSLLAPAPAVSPMSEMREPGMPPVATQTPRSVMSPMREQESQQQPSPWRKRPQEPSPTVNEPAQQAPPQDPMNFCQSTRA